MKSKPPPDRHKFSDTWDEIGYLYDKLLFWLYSRAGTEKARLYAERLKLLLPKIAPQDECIFGEECRSLLHEAEGNLQKAIKHRENEIRLIRQLHSISRDTPHEKVILKQYGYDDLSDQLDLLAVLYHDSGKLEKAIRTLTESKQLCEKHGIKFDGEDLLEEYLAEKASSKKTRRALVAGKK